MNISKAERKYRIKFIQEHHYKKSEQRIFDEFVMRMSITYKEVYKSMRSGMVFSFMATIAVARASKAIDSSIRYKLTKYHQNYKRI